MWRKEIVFEIFIALIEIIISNKIGGTEGEIIAIIIGRLIYYLIKKHCSKERKTKHKTETNYYIIIKK